MTSKVIGSCATNAKRPFPCQDALALDLAFSLAEHMVRRYAFSVLKEVPLLGFEYPLKVDLGLKAEFSTLVINNEEQNCSEK